MSTLPSSNPPIHTTMIVATQIMENKYSDFTASLAACSRISAASKGSPLVFISANRKLPPEILAQIQTFLALTAIKEINS